MSVRGGELGELSSAERAGVVVMGGGGGVSAVAPELVEVLPEECRLSLIVPTSDSGSATGQLRELLGAGTSSCFLPAVGDSRRVMASLGKGETGEIFGWRLGEGTTPEDVAAECKKLAKAIGEISVDGINPNAEGYLGSGVVEMAAQLVFDRYGSLKGHTIGNLVLASMMLSWDSFPSVHLGEAIEEVSGWLGIDSNRVRVLPSSIDPHHLYMQDGKESHETEGIIDEIEVKYPYEARVWSEHVDSSRQVEIYRPAYNAVACARVVLCVPSSLFTSHGAILAMPEMRDALRENTKAGGRFVVAATTVDRDTRKYNKGGYGIDALRYAELIGRMAGRMPDVMLVSDGSVWPGQRLLRHEPSQPTEGQAGKIDVRELSLLRPVQASRNEHDPHAALRSSVVTDPEPLAGVLRELLAAA